MARVQVALACAECGRPAPQWSGRCPGCGAWGSIEAAPRPVAASGRSAPFVSALFGDREAEARLSTGLPGLDRVLGGGLVAGSVVLLAGEPGIGKSTLVLQAVAGLASAGRRCLVASGEESAGQVASRARRLGVPGVGLRFVAGRELEGVIDAARAERPDLLAIDSVQTVRAEGVAGIAGGVAQVRACADALVGLAKAEGVSVLLVGHVTKDGDLAGPRTLEHAVDTILSFSGDPRSGLRTLASGKNRFGAEGEVAWMEMSPAGLTEIDPAGRLLEARGEAGAAVALCLAGRRAVAVEVQGLVVPTEGPPRRQVSGLDGRRFGMLGAVLEQARLLPPRVELYGASAGGM
ncbi:MAG: AAA family ATPase, partial [Actinomycetota bacterium]